ncbi:MAG: pseudouridine synthase [Hyphomicrobiaceae bacterium]|nr:pseudouridine synthase [Hyphomicrobiaceae bacterium]
MRRPNPHTKTGRRPPRDKTPREDRAGGPDKPARSTRPAQHGQPKRKPAGGASADREGTGTARKTGSAKRHGGKEPGSTDRSNPATDKSRRTAAASPQKPSRKSPAGLPHAKPRRGPRTPHALHSDDSTAVGAPGAPMRIAKAMARAGLCSRREAERWINDGRVVVNGRRLTTPACEVGLADKVLVDGKPLPAAEPPQLWRYHKPRGLVTTHADPEGRPTVFENLPSTLPRVISIGRLDFNTEGLLLLTNDGALARHLELPATGWLRRYRVRAHGRVTQADLDKLKNGVEIDRVRYGPVEATLDSLQGGNIWLTLALREGKNREVRRILEHLGLQVNRLIRVSYGPFQLLDLKPGETEPVKRRVLADQLGTAMAAELGLDRPDLVDARSGRPAKKNLHAKKTPTDRTDV